MHLDLQAFPPNSYFSCLFFMSHAYPVQSGFNSSSYFPVLCFSSLISKGVQCQARPPSHYFNTPQPTDRNLQSSSECQPLFSDWPTVLGCKNIAMLPSARRQSDYGSFCLHPPHICSFTCVLRLVGDHLSPSSAVTMAILATPSVAKKKVHHWQHPPSV